MLHEIGAQLATVAEQKRLKEKLERDLHSVETELQDRSSQLESLSTQLKKEEVDVDKLERTSLTALFYSVLGSRDEQLEKERQELLSIQLKHQQTKHQVDYLGQELSSLRGRLNTLTGIESQYESLLSEKERLLQETNQTTAAQLFDLSRQAADINAEISEITEAIAAGNAVTAGLDQVIDSLSSAENWGTWDMLGGGFISTAIKHSRIDEARDGIHDVESAMSQFKRELADVQKSIDLHIDIGEFNYFADYFFDGLIMDWIVQSKIEDSLARARDARKVIQHAVQQLEELRKTTQARNTDVKQKRAALIEYS